MLSFTIKWIVDNYRGSTDTEQTDAKQENPVISETDGGTTTDTESHTKTKTKRMYCQTGRE